MPEIALIIVVTVFTDLHSGPVSQVKHQPWFASFERCEDAAKGATDLLVGRRAYCVEYTLPGDPA